MKTLHMDGSRRSVKTNLPSNRLVRIVVEAVKAAGFKPTVLEGKAYRVAWIDGDGRRHTVPISRSPAASSAEKPVLSAARRALHAGG